MDKTGEKAGSRRRPSAQLGTSPASRWRWSVKQGVVRGIRESLAIAESLADPMHNSAMSIVQALYDKLAREDLNRGARLIVNRGMWDQWCGSVGDFLKRNDDEDLPLAIYRLTVGAVYRGGGGAQPEYTIELDESDDSCPEDPG